MAELLEDTKYTGQEIIDWIAVNPQHNISKEIVRRYYVFDDEWFDVKININPEKEYKIFGYKTTWHDYWGSYPRKTYRLYKIIPEQPRRSSLKKGQ